jgi:hypothetical protein
MLGAQASTYVLTAKVQYMGLAATTQVAVKVDVVLLGR